MPYGPRLTRIAALALVLTPAHLQPAGAQSASRLLVPSQGAVVHAPDVLAVLTVPATTRLLLKLDGKPISAASTPVPGNDEDLHHYRLLLEEGRHRYQWLEASTETELAAVTVTYIPPHSLRTVKQKDDHPYAFHTREREAACSGCHSLPEVFETAPAQPLAPAGKVCGACHPRIESAPVLHGPVAVYSCFLCHGSEYAPSRFAQKTSQAASCSTCHQSYLDRVLGGKKFVHGPVAAGVCLVCHDPHGGKSRALVREVPPTLCLLCHADTVPLPLEKSLHGRVACTQCHDAHGGQTAALTAAPGNEFCANCHADVAASAEGHPVPGHPVRGPVDPTKPGKPFGCSSCHGVHSLKDVSRTNIRANEGAQRLFCRKCHY